LLRRQVLDIWRPAAKAILLKTAQMLQRAGHGEEHLRLCELLKQETDLSKIESLLEQVNAAEDAFVAACEPLAFKDRAKDREELFRYQMAADYSDGWVEVKSGSGKLLGGFSSFYICRAGGAADPCNTLILNKEWSRQHEDMLAPKQKWKCRCCGSGYKTKFGMVVEIRMVGAGASLSLAPCTDQDDKDLHALILQEQFPDVKSAEELYELIPTVLPQESTFLRKAVQSDFWGGGAPTDFGVYKLLNFKVLQGLPMWNWKAAANFFTEQDLVQMKLKVQDGELVEC
jgi:hypothetical protein